MGIFPFRRFLFVLTNSNMPPRPRITVTMITGRPEDVNRVIAHVPVSPASNSRASEHSPAVVGGLSTRFTMAQLLTSQAVEYRGSLDNEADDGNSVDGSVNSAGSISNPTRRMSERTRTNLLRKLTNLSNGKANIGTNISEIEFTARNLSAMMPEAMKRYAEDNVDDRRHPKVFALVCPRHLSRGLLDSQHVTTSNGMRSENFYFIHSGSDSLGAMVSRINRKSWAKQLSELNPSVAIALSSQFRTRNGRTRAIRIPPHANAIANYNAAVPPCAILAFGRVGRDEDGNVCWTWSYAGSSGSR